MSKALHSALWAVFLLSNCAAAQSQDTGDHSQMMMKLKEGAAASEAGKAYMAAMMKMNRTMTTMEMTGDPTRDFVMMMIPHHQSAIDMAKVVLQHGKDEAVKKWANDVIREQEREIAEMQAWLKQHGKL